MTARTPSAIAALPTARRSGSVLSAALTLLVLGGIALAPPAAAVDDPATPDARVTHGPSCSPGGVVVEVTGGTVASEVTLATTRSPGGEDRAEVPAGETVVLRTGDVAWGETIDVRLEYRALDGSGASLVDELEGYTFTRPAEEDCAAIAAPAAAATVPSVEPATDGGPPAADGDAPAAAAEDGPEPGTGADPSPQEAGSDGTRRGGADAVPGPAAPAPGKLEVPGTTPRVELVEAAAPALSASNSVAPLLAAAVALAASAAGLAGVLGRARRTARQSTGSA